MMMQLLNTVQLQSPLLGKLQPAGKPAETTNTALKLTTETDSFTPSTVQERSGANGKGILAWAATVLVSLASGLHTLETKSQHFVYDESPQRVEEVAKALYCFSHEAKNHPYNEAKDRIYLAGTDPDTSRHIATRGGNRCSGHKSIIDRLIIGRVPYEGEWFSGIKNKYFLKEGQTAVSGIDLSVPPYSSGYNQSTPFIVGPAKGK